MRGTSRRTFGWHTERPSSIGLSTNSPFLPWQIRLVESRDALLKSTRMEVATTRQDSAKTNAVASDALKYGRPLPLANSVS